MMEDLQQGTKERLNKLRRNGETDDQLVNRILDEIAGNLFPNKDRTEAEQFMEIFNKISGPNKEDVEEIVLITELVNKLQVSEFTAKTMISKAKNQLIYERRAGVYAVA